MNKTNKLFWASAVVSIAGIVFEVLFGAVGSYVLGDGVKQYSITIGLFLTGMGIGSFLSERINKQLIQTFVIAEFAIGTIGGLSILTLFGISAYLDSGVDAIFLYLVILIVGGLTGLEMPILIRKVNELGTALNKNTARVLFFDYFGSLFGTILFVLALRTYLEFVRTAFLIAFFNILIGIYIAFVFKEEIKHLKRYLKVGTFLLVMMLTGFVFGNDVWFHFEQKLYRDPIMRTMETKYQRIVLTRYKNDIRLFINGNIQFSSTDEYRYHESLVHIPMSLAAHRENVLILGGGDGLAVKELLKYDEVKEITLVDLDKEMINFSKNDPLMTRLNNGSLESDKLNIYNVDALSFLKKNRRQLYDVILVDLPDPNDESLNKLYTKTFYAYLRNSLAPDGYISIQATSPLFAREVYWTISETVKSTGLHVVNYHVDVPSFGDWGFVLASRDKISVEKINIKVETKFLSNDMVKGLFYFGKDQMKPDKVEINTLNKPVIIQLYEKAWENY